jgi:hypothetical protein
MEFKNWLLLIETATIAQSIKQKISSADEYLQNILNDYLKYITKKVNDEIPPTVNQNTKRLYANFFAYHFFIEPILKNPTNFVPMSSSANVITNVSTTTQIFSQFNNFFNNVKDYLVAKKDDNALKSRLNNIDFTFDRLQAESNQWHQELAEKARGKGREAETFIDLSHLGPQWQGWRWVHINRKYCELEAASGGHCGNVSGNPDDNILSLRDPENKVHLTFIENNGILGEMKGRNNSKPSPKYHNPIIELLKNNKILTIKGGGFLKDNNFSLDDLANKEELLTIKPELDIGKFYEKKLSNEDYSPEEKVYYLEKLLDKDFENADNFVFLHEPDIFSFAHQISDWSVGAKNVKNIPEGSISFFEKNYFSEKMKNFHSWHNQKNRYWFSTYLNDVAKQAFMPALANQAALQYTINDHIEKIIKMIDNKNLEIIMDIMSDQYAPIDASVFPNDEIKNPIDYLIYVSKNGVPTKTKSGELKQNYQQRLEVFCNNLFVILRFCYLLTALPKIQQLHTKNLKEFYEEKTKDDYFTISIKGIVSADIKLNKKRINEFIKEFIQLKNQKKPLVSISHLGEIDGTLDPNKDVTDYLNAIIRKIIYNNFEPYIPSTINIDPEPQEFNLTLSDYLLRNDGLRVSNYAHQIVQKRLEVQGS